MKPSWSRTFSNRSKKASYFGPNTHRSALKDGHAFRCGGRNSLQAENKAALYSLEDALLKFKAGSAERLSVHEKLVQELNSYKRI